jgi:anti-sigma regulatory factor (Ser/Thr protein kinase)
VDADVVLADSVDAARQAREATAKALSRWHCSPACVEDAMLIVSEMVTNAVRHGGGRVQLRLGRSAGFLRVEVGDASPAPPRLLPLDPTAECGRGLRIVDRLASRWGSRPVQDGKVVWVDLRCPRVAGPVAAGAAR